MATPRSSRRLCRLSFSLRPRLRQERGASLVEFAFVLPILLTLVFGIVEYGVAFNNYVALRQGVREGARQAVVGNYGTDSSCTTTSGTPSTTNAKKLVCLTRSRIGTTDPTKVRVALAFPDTAAAHAVGDRVRVCAQYELKSVTKYPLFSPLLNNRKFTSKVEMRAEQIPSGATLTAFEESPLSGSSGWC